MYYGANTLNGVNPLQPTPQDYVVVFVQEFYNPFTGRIVEKVKKEPIKAYSKSDADRVAEELTRDKFRKGLGVFRVKTIRKV